MDIIIVYSLKRFNIKFKLIKKNKNNEKTRD
jgi:hypothetical protein